MYLSIYLSIYDDVEDVISVDIIEAIQLR